MFAKKKKKQAKIFLEIESVYSLRDKTFCEKLHGQLVTILFFPDLVR